MRYEKPEMEMLELHIADILTVSGDGTHEEGSDPGVDFGQILRAYAKKGAGYEKREKINSKASGCHHSDNEYILDNAGS